MKDRLAEKLLAKVMGWTVDEMAAERPVVQALASYKYDEYQQFSAGSHFIENLALWLRQFVHQPERRAAYDFVKTRMIFCSANEMRHFVEMAYPDHIRPILIERTASPPDRFRPRCVAAGAEFKLRQRKCLFLGLSDGARIDAFRRANPQLNHEQIWQTYELSAERVSELLKKLSEHLPGQCGGATTEPEPRFETIVLLDDFSASGTSYFSGPVAAPSKGKITSFFRKLCDETNHLYRLVDHSRLEVITLLYVATEKALDYMKAPSEATWGSKGIKWSIHAVQPIPQSVSLSRDGDQPIDKLIAAYYDPEIFDAHMQKGESVDGRLGYADCGLPLVLHHNSPNNAIALLMSYEILKIRGLFPRVQRHRDPA